MEDPIELGMDELLKQFDVMSKQLKTMTSQLKKLQKKYQKEKVKNAKVKKNIMKVKVEDIKMEKKVGSKVKISDELSDFLGLDKNENISKIDVNRKIYEYIDKNKLLSGKNKKEIVPDEALQQLLKVEGEEPLGYFNLPEYLNVHFTTV
jgi:chromatin remodeling complex protein RSC6